MRLRAPLILASLLILLVVAAGCDGDGDGDGDGSQDGASGQASGAESTEGSGNSGTSNGSGSGGDSAGEADGVEQAKVPKELAQRFKGLGDEASAEEQEQIVAALVAWREAMAAEDWDDACAYLQASLREDSKPPKLPENLPDQVEIPEDFPKTCAERLARAAENPGPEGRDGELRIGTVWVLDDRAFVLYKSGGGEVKWFLIRAVREDGNWKLASPRALPVG
jgi:Spy/CpxP family protein refolding chaperone